ncbi:HD domain-containing protein [Candidatus Thorarchaeota archaeon]|nr:MAG: HD domain-containing protein [Candidatus Thorarchaeota archaeon]
MYLESMSLINEEDAELIQFIRLTGLREHEIKEAQHNHSIQEDAIQQLIREHNQLIEMSEKHSRQKAIQDPIYGAILMDPWELDVISTWEMLRLRYVMQLGPAHIVYPGATHTRFLHCIGTNHLAQKSIRVVNYCEDLDKACFLPISGLLDDYQKKLFRAAALLHDVGHPPTSHTIEFALKQWSGLDHLALGEYLILNSGLTEILIQNDFQPYDIVNILRRRTKNPVLMLLSDFLDHPLDIDKTDYLIRDAHFSGVQLGVFPAERVMLTNRVVKDDSGNYIRAFMLKAIHSLEALILSRNWMFADLYLHHAVKLAEALLSKATYFRLEEEGFSKNECIGFFTRMTDADLFRWLQASEIDFVREYVSRIRYRRLFKVALLRPLVSFEPDAKKRLISMLDDITLLIEAEREISENPGSVVLDVVVPELGEKRLSKIPLLVGGDRGFDIVPLDESKDGGPLLQTLKQQTRTIPSVRVYCDPDIANDVRKRFEAAFPMTKLSNHREEEYDLTEY